MMRRSFRGWVSVCACVVCTFYVQDASFPPKQVNAATLGPIDVRWIIVLGVVCEGFGPKCQDGARWKSSRGWATRLRDCFAISASASALRHQRFGISASASAFRHQRFGIRITESLFGRSYGIPGMPRPSTQTRGGCRTTNAIFPCFRLCVGGRTDNGLECCKQSTLKASAGWRAALAGSDAFADLVPVRASLLSKILAVPDVKEARLLLLMCHSTLPLLAP